jgi:LysM repeat protein
VNKPYNYPLENQKFHKPKGRNPNVVLILAGVLVLAGLGLLVFWLSGPSRPLNSLFATDTPTPTITLTPSLTPLPTETPTVTTTPTETATATASAPFTYTVQEGDSLAVIADKFGLGENGIKLTLLLNPFSENTGTGIDPGTQIVYPGQQLLIPNPGMELPTATAIPPNLPRGTPIDYTVESGDSLAAIASKFNSTEEAILAIEDNNLDDPNSIFIGQLLRIPVNLVTPTATRPPTSTPSTPVAAATTTATVTPQP